MDARESLEDLLVAAEMAALEAPYVVVCRYSDGELSFAEGPYAEGVSALKDALALEDSPLRAENTHYTIAPLWPPSSSGPVRGEH
jgi:hypothetical protein